MSAPPRPPVADLDPALLRIEAAVAAPLAAAGFMRRDELALSWLRVRPDGGQQHVDVDLLASGAVAINLFAVTADGGIHNAPVPAVAGRAEATYRADPAGLERASADLLGAGVRWLEAH